jgi:hypothetical protein
MGGLARRDNVSPMMHMGRRRGRRSSLVISSHHLLTPCTPAAEPCRSLLHLTRKGADASASPSRIRWANPSGRREPGRMSRVTAARMECPAALACGSAEKARWHLRQPLHRRGAKCSPGATSPTCSPSSCRGRGLARRLRAVRASRGAAREPKGASPLAIRACGIADPPHAVVCRCDLHPRIPGRLRLRPALPPRGRAGELPSQTTVSSPSTGSSSSHRWFSSRIVRVPGRSRARCCLTTCLRAQGPGREREGHSRRPARLRCLLRGLPCRYAEVLAPEAFSTALVNLIA